LKLGKFKVNDDEELVGIDAFDQLPMTIQDSGTFYPDTHPESTSVDGDCQMFHMYGTTWSTIKAEGGSSADDTATEMQYQMYCYSTETVGRWWIMQRMIFLFDTHTLTAQALVGSGTLSLYAQSKQAGSCSPSINIYSSAPASNTALAAGDFDSLGTTAFCDTPVAYGSWGVGYVDFVLNAAGKAAVDIDGITKMGGRNPTYDAGSSEPPWSIGANAFLQAYTANQGNGYKPKLALLWILTHKSYRRSIIVH
jgi:hypothetical protein